jgi:hypothetical protein
LILHFSPQRFITSVQSLLIGTPRFFRSLTLDASRTMPN